MKKVINLLSLLIISVILLTSCSGITDALFPPDYKEITNNIFTKYIEMNLIVETHSEGSSAKYKSQGSAVIYGRDDYYYYCLTNAHVIETDISSKNVSYTVTDCYGKTYNALFVHADVSRDLAVLKFISGDNLCVVELADSDPAKNENVVAISTSNHLINAVTYGKIRKYETIDIFDDNGGNDTRVTFPVIWHDAPMWDGASGSALLNLDMELVGINYAVATNSSNQFIYGFAVGVSHVREYLEENNLIIK